MDEAEKASSERSMRVSREREIGRARLFAPQTPHRRTKNRDGERVLKVVY